MLFVSLGAGECFFDGFQRVLSMQPSTRRGNGVHPSALFWGTIITYAVKWRVI
jgi:hypothetical protein